MTDELATATRTKDPLEDLPRLDTVGLRLENDTSDDYARYLQDVAKTRRWAAAAAWFSSVVGFAVLIAFEMRMLANEDADVSVQVAGWRGAVAISGALFAYGLLRAADRLSMPLDMLNNVDLERARQRQGVSAKDLTAALSALADAIGRVGK